jgi:hypothetical protein
MVRNAFLTASPAWGLATVVWLVTGAQWARVAAYLVGLAWVILAYVIIVRTWPNKPS